jgi:hypothetical protein
MRHQVNTGDEVFIDGKLYKIMTPDDAKDGGEIHGGDFVLRREGLCSACNKNPGDDFQHIYGNLCGRCITTAMEGYALQCVLNHLMQNDDEIVEVMHVMERIDTASRLSHVQHVDFHSATMDAMWSWSDDDWHEIIMSWHASIRRVVESRVLLSPA